MKSQQLMLLLAFSLAGAAGAPVVRAQSPLRKPAVRPASGFALFANAGGFPDVVLTANRVVCLIVNYGLQCPEGESAEVYYGASWPRGTQDNYVFQGGLQLAATVPANAGFRWAGDTVGTFFVDLRGDQRQGDAVTNVFDSRRAADLALWPTAAYTNDTSLYDPMLIGRPAVSDQDTWVRYWDGNPSLSTGRQHMMGVVVDQRTLAFNAPTADQDILYFIFRIINITSSLPASYANLAAYGYSAADQQQLAGLGAQFQANARSRDSSLVFPDSGYTFRNLYVAYTQDPDIGNASYNFSTAVLPFSLVAAMKYNYSEPLFQYPTDLFSSPFTRAPGYEAIQFLRGLSDSGGTWISVWGNTCSGCGTFSDPVGVSQLYRSISGHVTPALGDGACTTDPATTHTCLAIQRYADTRFFSSTGPADLAPGHSVLVAVAMLYAAPLARWAATTNGIYAMPADSLASYIGPANGGAPYTYVPGWPAMPDTLAQVGTAGGSRVCTGNCTTAATIRDPIERAMGWGQFGDANGDGRIEMNEVQTAPLSLLNKAQVAQAIFDHKFLLPSAPAAPRFFLIPGDSQVTVVWEKSATEVAGDPYYAVASNPTSPLYDPDYRRLDVQGYRIWRGTSAADLQVVAEFDYDSTTFTDYTGEVYDPAHSQCAPELGLDGPANCAVAFQFPYLGTGPSVTYSLDQPPLIQIPPGGRVRLADGSVAVLRADTAHFGYPYAVPFAYVDHGVRNSFQYVYAVTAFDVNSLASGPSSLQSPLVLQTVTPRVPAVDSHGATIVTGVFGDDGVALDPTAPGPTVDSATGAFSGPVPPTDGASFALVGAVPDALPAGDIIARIDSITPGFTGGISTPPPTLYVTFSAGADTVRQAVAIPSQGFTASPEYGWNPFALSIPLARYDTARAVALGLSSGYASRIHVPATLSGFVAPLSASDAGATLITLRYGGTGITQAGAYLMHAVWYDEGAAEPPQPTVNPFGSQAHTNGQLTGVDVIYQPIAYRQPIGTDAASGQVNVNQRYVEYATPAAYHPADFVVTWNADSSLTVRDSTHHVNLPFRPDLSASWGFVDARGFTAAGVTAADLSDGTGSPQVGVVGYHHEYALAPVCAYFGVTCAPLENKAQLEPVDYRNLGPATGSGIVLYLDGMFFVMQLSALPAPGTKWHLKAVSGDLDATCPTLPIAPSLVPAACSGYRYTPFFAGYRPAYVPGLSYRIRVAPASGVTPGSGDLSRIHTVPDPYYNHSGYETAGGPRILRFVNLPARCIIRIYSTSGILIRVLTHNDPTDGGEEPWDLLSRGGDLVASGVYFYEVEGSDGRQRIGRMTIINMTN